MAKSGGLEQRAAAAASAYYRAYVREVRLGSAYHRAYVREAGSGFGLPSRLRGRGPAPKGADAVPGIASRRRFVEGTGPAASRTASPFRG